MDPNYFRGVAVGLLIAWVTNAVAYYVVSARGGSMSSLLPKLIIFEVVVCAAMFGVYYWLK
jgi:hypothetical protein